MADAKRPSLSVEERTERGSREARRLRRAGFVPGVLYGASHPDPVALKIGARELRHLLVDGSALFDVAIAGQKSVPAILKDRQNHPVRDEVLHVDFLEVRLDEKISSTVAIELEGGRGVARREGGRRARPVDPRGQHRGPAHRHPRADRGQRGAHGHGRHAHPRRRPGPGRRRLPRPAGGDHHRQRRGPDQGRGARDRGGDRARGRGRRADRGRARRGRGGRGPPPRATPATRANPAATSRTSPWGSFAASETAARWTG